LEQASAYELSRGILRTHIYNFEVGLTDLRDRAVDNATILLDGVPERSAGERAVFQLVPEGNHSLEIWFKGVKLYDGWAWAGYHPTYHFRSPSTGARIKLEISDLLVQAVDGAGRPVGAAFSVEGPTPETTIRELYSAGGLLNLSQLPMAEYRVRAVNYSKPFSRQVEASGAFKPGQPGRIALPIYEVRLRVLDARGRPGHPSPPHRGIRGRWAHNLRAGSHWVIQPDGKMAERDGPLGEPERGLGQGTGRKGEHPRHQDQDNGFGGPPEEDALYTLRSSRQGVRGEILRLYRREGRPGRPMPPRGPRPVKGVG